ncbi:cobalamin biosynthesis protein [Aquibium sp. A9E412]|uniref:cobalamin biosynthesis protein n=1 Tax=Aquibium sp. A9E412 TaxID=2976767 RepID=UPI0025B1A02E|nr:cobalamin biosynthesis protein [Aquibium sp. A9E412]MDN2565847.1 cobalamin biosynthesis protein [Aquibium sp. A9E412]
MIVAGIGARRGASVAAVLAAVSAATRGHGLAPGDVGLLASSAAKAAEPGLAGAAAALGLRLAAVAAADLQRAAARTLTHSPRALAATGVPSLSEAAALAAAGPRGRLIGPRHAEGPVTCALATTEEP